MSRAIWTRGHPLDPVIVAALDETGHPWEIEISKKHRKIMIAGRCAAVLSLKGSGGQGGGRDGRNVVSAIKRMGRAISNAS